MNRGRNKLIASKQFAPPEHGADHIRLRRYTSARSCVIAALLSTTFVLGPIAQAKAQLIMEELMLPIAHVGTGVSTGLASSNMIDHCQKIFDEFRGTTVFVDYEIDTRSTYSFAEIAVDGEIIKMTPHPIKAHYKFFSNELPDHLRELGAQAVIFRINNEFKHPSVEIRFSNDNRFECNLIASPKK
ncbi:hypothetical protein GCM10007094_18960 [Pseudovibrio japonicus]|uniref:Uncharacterized protein n=1 Tax=Pseudovibrio japonicus TaxID=366534 RepID=A0ABQ3ECP2_9HYPH|nr:hypothetical protein [Pseudovibrio japonicus]GHB30738.1 hypothetical protein GCM10007094_18960 [Pseudovibrio japonicus]